jgi:hypothetical protein
MLWSMGDFNFQKVIRNWLQLLSFTGTPTLLRVKL